MMNDSERARLEDEVRALCEQGDHDAATTLSLRGYGAEIFGFLIAMHGDEAASEDAFSAFAEGLWRGLPSFAWASTLRTWAYAIARNVGRGVQRDAALRERRNENVGPETLAEIAAAIRTETLAFLRTEKRSRLHELRESLSPEDRALLVLRLDRGLAWNDLARVLSDGSESLDDASTLREAARLRKRYQLVKDRLREMAREKGLLE